MVEEYQETFVLDIQGGGLGGRNRKGNVSLEVSRSRVSFVLFRLDASRRERNLTSLI